MNEHESSSPESPAKEQPGEVAAMVKRLRSAYSTVFERSLAKEAAALIEKLVQEPGRSIINWTTEGCPKHNGQSWTMGVATVYTQIAKRCPLCEPPSPERP